MFNSAKMTNTAILGILGVSYYISQSLVMDRGNNGLRNPPSKSKYHIIKEGGGSILKAVVFGRKPTYTLRRVVAWV